MGPLIPNLQPRNILLRGSGTGSGSTGSSDGTGLTSDGTEDIISAVVVNSQRSPYFPGNPRRNRNGRSAQSLYVQFFFFRLG